MSPNEAIDRLLEDLEAFLKELEERADNNDDESD